MKSSFSQKRSVTHINTHGREGGAAKMAGRLGAIQRQNGWDANLLVGRQSGAPGVHGFDPQESHRLKLECLRSGGLFYALQGSHRLFAHPLIQNADIIHLHNLHGAYFNPFSLHFLAHVRPVVWTLHDMQAFTGHCAHAFDCLRWQQGCGQCPYLETEPALAVDTTAQLLADKRLVYEHTPLWIVTPSNWLKAKAEKSILGLHPIDTIPNGVDTTVFKPMDRQAARHALGLPGDKLLVGAVANGGTLANPWKGGEYTEAAMDFLQAQYPEVCFVDVGGKSSFRDPRRLSLPPIADEGTMALIYNALDLFLYTPRADNCPLVVLEAMACGLPQASFDTGGIPELLQDGQQGCLARFQDIHGLVQAARFLLTHPEQRHAMGARARERALLHFDQASMAAAYKRRYEAILSEYPQRRKAFAPLPMENVPDLVRTDTFIKAHREVWQGPAFAPAHFQPKKGEGGPALPRISVITPSFNQADYLEACIRSVLEQDYPNIEYIVMDGGSTDGSRAIIEKYAHRLAYWQSRPDNGHYWAVDEGIRRSTGEIITWLNSDDQFHPHAFKVAACIFMQRPDVAWITGRPNNINADGTKFSQKAILPVWSRQQFLDRQYHRPFIQQEGTFWRRSLWDQAGGELKTELSLAGDMELWTRFFRHASLFSVDYNFAAYRTHGENRALLHMDRYIEEAESVIDLELKLFRERRWPRLAPPPEWMTKKQIAAYLSASGLHRDVRDVRDVQPATPAPPKPALSIRLSPLTLSPVEPYDEPILKGSSKGEGIDISLILPTKDRSQGLADVLESIPAAMGDRTYEIILCADNDKNTGLKEIIGKHAIRKVLYDGDLFGSHESFSWSKLMNQAFAQASGEWIMYASDDIVFYPHCFSLALSSIEKIEKNAVSPVGGITFLHRNTVETHGGAFETFGYDSINGDKNYINFGLIHAEAFRQTDGFDENFKFFWADVDICLQLWAKGYRIVASHRSLVDHHNALEGRQQASRQQLFAHDTQRFLEKWKASALFVDRNPLEKIRYFLSPQQSKPIIDSLRASAPARRRDDKGSPLHIVIDGVIFQLQHQRPLGISRVWRNLLPELVRALPDARFTILERRGYPVPGGDLAKVVVAPYVLGDEDALDADDEMLRRTCATLGADLFISTYFTRAPGFRNISLVHDLIPEIMSHDLTLPEWRSKRRALDTVDGAATVSQCTLNDLKRHYPHVVRRPVAVVPNGIGRAFAPVTDDRIAAFKRRYDQQKPYLLMVGNRHLYKNGAFLFDCLRNPLWNEALQVLCVGGEGLLTATERQMADNGRVRFIPRLDDETLAAAYAGAEAYVCFSKYEGFGLPVLEAMACSCPVITTPHGALRETAGEAALYVDGISPREVLKAIAQARQPERRRELIARGLDQAARFSWSTAASAMAGLIRQVAAQPAVLVSAIVSTYNSERFIRGCLEDLQAQTIAQQIEIVVIDSASAQNEGTVVREFQGRFGNIKYIRTQKREPLYAAWNRGIKLAQGKYVTSANTDDRHRRDAFEQMVAVLEDKPGIALVYADVIKTATANETFTQCTPTGVLSWFDWDRQRLLSDGCFMGPQPMWQRSVHDVFGFFDESLTVSADYEFWLRISQVFDFQRIPRPLGLYLERADSVEHADQEKKRSEDRKINEFYRRARKSETIIGFIPFERMGTGDPVLVRKALHEIRRMIQAADLDPAGEMEAHFNELDSRLNRNSAGQALIEGFIKGVGRRFLLRQRESKSAAAITGTDAICNESTPQGGAPMQLAEKLNQGINLLLENGHQETVQWMLDRLLTEFPHDARFHHERAILYHGQGEMASAGQHFQRAAELAPTDAIIQKSLGDFQHVVQGQTAKAIDQYLKVLRLDPDQLDTLLTVAHLHVSLRRFDDARQYYEKVLAIDPGRAEAAQILNRLNQELEKQALRQSPETFYQQACAQVQAGQPGAAIQSLETLLTHAPDHAPAHNDLGVLYYENGDHHKARLHYEKAAELAPENTTYLKNLADFYYVDQAEVEKALKLNVQVLSLDPQDIEALMSTGHICMALGQNEDARVFFKRVLEIDPEHNEANLLLQQMDSPVGSASAQSAPVAMDSPPFGTSVPRAPVAAETLYLNDQDEAAAGDVASAINALQQLIASEPNDAMAYNDLGVLYYEQGDKDQALRHYEQAKRLDPQNLTILKNLADFYFVEQGRIEDALTIYVDILKSDREDIDALMASGTICSALEKDDDARVFYERILEIDPWHDGARLELDRIANAPKGPFGESIAAFGQKMAL